MTEFLTNLSVEDLARNGLEGFAYGYRDKVRFHELDALNHVNNVVFLRWFETIRVAYVQDYGFTSYSEGDPMLVVRRVSTDYLAPMFQNEIYTVAARTSLIKPSSFVMEYAVSVDGNIRATGDAVVISLQDDGRTRRSHDINAIDNVLQRDGARREG